jgi:hypothetical protein
MRAEQVNNSIWHVADMRWMIVGTPITLRRVR